VPGEKEHGNLIDKIPAAELLAGNGIASVEQRFT
jgi:hypothetical protein